MKQAAILTIGTIGGMILASVIVALIASLTQSETATATEYNNPTNHNQDTFTLDLTDYEPDQDIQAVKVVIQTEGDYPREYRRDTNTGSYYLVNPVPGERMAVNEKPAYGANERAHS